MSHAVGGRACEGAVAATLQVDVGAHAILLHLSRHDVHHAAHGIAAIDGRGRTADHLYAVGQHGLIGVGQRMTVETGILWQSVDEHEQVGRAADASHLDSTGRSGAQSVAEDAACGDEESRHLLAQCGQHRRLISGREPRAADDGHVEGQVADVGLIACARDHHVAEAHRVGLCIKGISSTEQCCQHEDLPFHK